jgi:hypothetical protein
VAAVEGDVSVLSVLTKTWWILYNSFLLIAVAHSVSDFQQREAPVHRECMYGSILIFAGTMFIVPCMSL